MIFIQMRNLALPLLNKIIMMPFNAELSAGSLPAEKFMFYLTQDALYLADYSRALALVAGRLPNSEYSQQFIEFALEAIQAERALHLKYIQANLKNAESMPACFMYSNYLLRMASLAPVEEAVASLLPCFWVYAEVGRQMAERVVLDEHPYQEWIALYAGEQFAASAEAAIKITNALANSASEVSQKNMLAAFQKSTQLEWLFWHEAYHQANFQQIL